MWPRPLVLDYADWPIATTAGAIVPPALLVLAIVGTTAWALRAHPPAGFVGACFLLILAPTSSVLPIVTELAAERRMYLPLAAVVVLAVLGGFEALRRFASEEHARRRPGPALVAAVAVALAVGTVLRNRDYRTELGLWTDTVAKRPRNGRAHNNLGAALARLGDVARAVPCYEEALRIRPDYAEARFNLGNALLGQGRLEEAASHYAIAARLMPGFARAHMNYGAALLGLGRLDAAVAQLEEAARLAPDDPDAQRSLAVARARVQASQQSTK